MTWIDDILEGVQGVAEEFMPTWVTITNRKPADKDAENPFGDDIVEWKDEDESITIRGWLIDPATKSLDDTGGMNVVVSQPTLRLPVGTVITRGAKVVIAGQEFSVVGDPSDVDSWPAMLKVVLAREE